MSWLFSRALVEEYSEDICSDGVPFAQSSGSHTQQAYLPPDKMTAFSRLSQSGMMFKPLTGDHGAELLTSFLAAFPAKTSVALGKLPELREIALACGNTWRGLLAKFDPDTSLWKTAQGSLLGGSTEFSVIWPRSGMTVDGQCWALTMSERPTSARGSGLWPTMTANDCKPAGKVEVMEYRQKNCRTTVMRLRSAATEPHQIGLALNPTWIEWFMGWPLGWTGLGALEMDKFLKWQRQHGIFFTPTTMNAENDNLPKASNDNI
ncbi:hypothetical protein [Bradyrhizobium sp. OK095]|uniref:hypothetical protein n=1 Tax=Bradyrhizobium sp. OK095 TaxID=1882760 RepID=UPI0008C3C16A|nr:hypothetical protein [Bradyrhizobium sp. OK095]SEN19597.1 hypothetical protein SAMN05443254_106435 [Bradyrhizobium sp. OK095]